MKTRLVIVAGGGELPYKVIQFCRFNNIEFKIVGIKKFFNSEASDIKPDLLLDLLDIDILLDFLKSNLISEIVFVGNVTKPNFSSLLKNASSIVKNLSLFQKINSLQNKGDDSILRAVAMFFEQKGYRVVSYHKFIQEELEHSGVLGKIYPNESEYIDIHHGLKVVKSLGDFDIGQSIILFEGLVLGLEAQEGTDNLLERCSFLRQSCIGGVLVKASKNIQDHRFDLPTIGPTTIERMHKYKFSGVAIESGKVIIINKSYTLDLANKKGIFVVSI